MSDPNPAEEVRTAVQNARARTDLSAAVQRLADLTGLDLHALDRRDGTPVVALAVTDAPPVLIAITGATVTDAYESAAAFVTRIASAVDRMRVRRVMPPIPKVEPKELRAIANTVGTKRMPIGPPPRSEDP